MSDNINTLVVGAGLIAREYVKVLLALGMKPIVVTRGQQRASELKTRFPDVKVVTGGLENFLKTSHPPSHAFVATPSENLAIATKQLITHGAKNILVEKPLTYSIQAAREISILADKFKAQIYIAFNRRNYQSVIKAKELVQSDGGVSSFHFDFTEAVFRIYPGNYSPEVTRYWGIANSSHVIDTAFHIGGQPEWMECRQYGHAVQWHSAGSIFTGIGETANGIPFTYHANWGCPGRWNIEIMTPKRKLMFSPMEKLQQQEYGSFTTDIVAIENDLDINYKPGFFAQVKAVLESTASSLFALNEFDNFHKNIRTIFNYE